LSTTPTDNAPTPHTSAVAADEHAREPAGHGRKDSFFKLALGSVGVVFGDIGTSPLYALREALSHVAHDGQFTRAEVIGIVSLLIWSIFLIVTLKYVLFLMRADNKGEGGMLTLLALVQGALGRRTRLMSLTAIAGAALFYGDSMITPAISVLSAVEGLKLVTPASQPYVLPLAIVILVALFAVQSRGTGKVAAFFGPITAIWFLVMAGLGVMHIADDMEILTAFDPRNGLYFLFGHGLVGFVVLGAVFLAVTGAEALYADMGHFGRDPIRFAWLVFVMPALVLNYLGQGAMVLADPATAREPFFLLAPEAALLPLVILATLATIIASQAVITGAFSITQQAIQLGLLPRMEIRFTSETQAGQIYMPKINMIILIGVLVLVMTFRTSSNLASAYGIAVTGAMVLDTCLFFGFLLLVWKWGVARALVLIIPLLIIEIAFFAANAMKLHEGGWIPLVFAAVLMIVMSTWTRGSRLLSTKTRRETMPIQALIKSLTKVQRVPGTAVFLTSEPEAAPQALLHNLKHNKVLHQTNVILSVVTRDTPRVPISERTEMEQLGPDFWRVTLAFGYMEQPNVPLALAQCRKIGLKFDIMSTSFFLGRRTLIADPRSYMPRWQDRLYIGMAKSSLDATRFFHIPSGRVVEMGTQVLI
jgi:KUP system potassium uptake protein